MRRSGWIERLSGEIPMLSFKLWPRTWPRCLIPCSAPLYLSGCFDRLPHTPGWGPALLLFLLTFLRHPVLESWTCWFVIDISVIAHICKHCLCWDSLLLFLAYFDTMYSLPQILRVSTAPLIVCMLSVLPHRSHTSYNSIYFQQFKFSSRVTPFPCLPIPQFNDYFLREGLCDIPNKVMFPHYIYQVSCRHFFRSAAVACGIRNWCKFQSKIQSSLRPRVTAADWPILDIANGP